MSYYTVKASESISDVVLNATGSLKNWDSILTANNLTDWTPILSVGQQIFIPDGINTTLQLQSNVQRILTKYPACNNVKSGSRQENSIIIPMPFIISPSIPIVVPIAAGTLITRIAFRNVSGSGNVSVKIGKTNGGTEIMPVETFNQFLDIQNPAINNGLNYTPVAMNLYFAATSGSCRVRIDMQTNYL